MHTAKLSPLNIYYCEASETPMSRRTGSARTPLIHRIPLRLTRLLRKLRLATHHLIPYTQLDDATLLLSRTLRTRLATFHLPWLRIDRIARRHHRELFTSVELAA